MNARAKTRYIHISKWNDYYELPTIRVLKFLIFFASQCGFDKVIKYRNNRVFINEAAYHEWIRRKSINRHMALDPSQDFQSNN